jgi:SdrD B-like domain
MRVRRGDGWYTWQRRLVLVLMLLIGLFTIVTPGLSGESKARGSISGTKYLDRNKDGQRSGNEPGIDGWTIELWDADETSILATTATFNGGVYSFTDLTPGTVYVVKEAGKGGWSHSYPPIGRYTVTIPSSSNLEISNIDFGNMEERPGGVEPEFPTLGVPVATFIGFGFVVSSIRKKNSDQKGTPISTSSF